jgi:hypothetical protein
MAVTIKKPNAILSLSMCKENSDSHTEPQTELFIRNFAALLHNGDCVWDIGTGNPPYSPLRIDNLTKEKLTGIEIYALDPTLNVASEANIYYISEKFEIVAEELGLLEKISSDDKSKLIGIAQLAINSRAHLLVIRPCGHITEREEATLKMEEILTRSGYQLKKDLPIKGPYVMAVMPTKNTAQIDSYKGFPNPGLSDAEFRRRVDRGEFDD